MTLPRPGPRPALPHEPHDAAPAQATASPAPRAPRAGKASGIFTKGPSALPKVSVSEK